MELCGSMELVLPHSIGGDTMNRLALLTLAAAALLATAGGASAQMYSGPGYGPHMEPRYDRDYDRDNDGRRFRDERRYRHTYNGCPPRYTVQDGVCKPYRGY
jgi:hypothetical protein